MEIKQFITGVLNNFKLFYGNVEFSYDDSEEVYEALKGCASKEMLKSKEMWTATFEFKKKKYGIMGDGEMTSSGSYILVEIEDERARSPKKSTGQKQKKMKKEIKNLTPHAITIVDCEGKVIRAIESSGLVRLTAKTVSQGEADGIPLSKTVFGRGIPSASP